jgi:hypothetical protein
MHMTQLESASYSTPAPESYPAEHTKCINYNEQDSSLASRLDLSVATSLEDTLLFLDDLL